MTTPWSEMLQTATRFGLAPPAFWVLSLREWRLLTAPQVGKEPLGRVVFERLAERWPDD